MDFEQERCPPVHAATDLKGYDSTVTHNAVHNELVGRGLCDQFAGFLDMYAVALAYDERGKLAKLAQAVAERVVRRGKQDEKSASIRMRECRRMRAGRRASPY